MNKQNMPLHLSPGDALYLSPAGIELNQSMIDTHIETGSDLDQTPLGEGVAVAMVLGEQDGVVETIILGAASEEPVANLYPQWNSIVDAPKVLYLAGMTETEPMVLVELNADTSAEELQATDIWPQRIFNVGNEDLNTTYALISPAADVDQVQHLVKHARIFFGRHYIDGMRVEQGWQSGRIYKETVSSADTFSNKPFETWHRILRRQDFPLNVWGTWLPNPEFN